MKWIFAFTLTLSLHTTNTITVVNLSVFSFRSKSHFISCCKIGICIQCPPRGSYSNIFFGTQIYKHATFLLLWYTASTITTWNHTQINVRVQIFFCKHSMTQLRAVTCWCIPGTFRKTRRSIITENLGSYRVVFQAEMVFNTHMHIKKRTRWRG